MKREANSVASLVSGSDELRSVEEDLYGSLVESPVERRRRLRRRRKLRRVHLIGSIKAAVVCGLVLCLWLYAPSLYKLNQIRGEIRDLQAQCREWEEKNQLVMADILYASSDDFVRYAARETLGLVDKGSTLYVADLSKINRVSTDAVASRETQALAMNAPDTH